MIVLWCLLAIIGLGQCQSDFQLSKFEVERSINRTIEEVEKMVRENPSLPRLTRRQIVDILYNITNKDVDSFEDIEKSEKAREMYQRALMIVLPYNAENSSENLDDLYKKPPIVQIIPDPTTTERVETILVDGVKEEIVYSNVPEQYDDIYTHATERPTIKPTQRRDSSLSNKYKNHKESYSEIQTKTTIREHSKVEPAPMKFSFDLENLQRNSYKDKSTSTTTKRPIFYKQTLDRGNRNGSNPEFFHTRKNTSDGNRGITIDLRTTPSSRTSQSVLTSDQWRYNAPPSTTDRTVIWGRGKGSVTTSSPTRLTFLPTPLKESPEEFKPSVTTMNPYRSTKSPKTTRPKSQTPLFVTPMTAVTSTSDKKLYSSSSLIADSSLEKEVTTIATTPMREDIEKLLASIGLRAGNIEDIWEKHTHAHTQNEILDSRFQIPDTNSVGSSPVAALTAPDVNSPSIASQNTFENPNADFKRGMNNLTPDVQLLFQRFGLQTSLKDSELTMTTTTTTAAPTESSILSFYTNFKPLPDSKVMNEDMKEFLAKFGLGTSEVRGQKAMKPPTTTTLPSLIEAVPEHMKKILENIGLISRRRKESTTTTAPAKTESEYHVFKPHKAVVNDERQKLKINELLDMVKMVQEGKASVRDVHKLANELLESTRKLRDGPDPLSIEEIIKLYNNDMKNEVKREKPEEEYEPSETTATTTTTTATTTTTTETSVKKEDKGETTTETSFIDSAKAATDTKGSVSTTTDSTSIDLSQFLIPTTPSGKSASSTKTDFNLDALADSFGGSTEAPDPVLPTKRRSGLYFLVDWNTFLEVGEEGKDKINLRFQPKVGDRSRFIPVMIP
ncbi:uncharacterized protein [Prorops nasuta]|uniref:uncharacterized protein isoform X2 n=1 Tax=Prorops nasuta TaxID=863751 RepID=UPI0034D00EE5